MVDGLYATPITVLGVGNIILSDEGFGVRVVEYLSKNYEFPDEVMLVDGGTLGIELTQYVTGAEKLLIIDSINSGGQKGKIFKFTNDEVLAHFDDKLSAHEVGIKDVLALLKITGKYPKEVVVLGAEPYKLEAGVGLSQEMLKLLTKVADISLKVLEEWGVNFLRKSESNIDLSTVAEEIIRKDTL